ncbi:hypothetical protein CAPTEDRAFT_215933 [Capitella teleta]|uniref:G-protein coupled receptors family 1 profile domain-containing protein n=1 Tax=Capitella teleta TaxID=283909 RepID=R7V780_CAPTE|nr:hypothetical protein CAPTEDRAFT_215933 [Capitella teleta]|eukprot:ELU14312.1 hypothetical protein CAPTEDRAFT_215933 [Capitella teleta]
MAGSEVWTLQAATIPTLSVASSSVSLEQLSSILVRCTKNYIDVRFNLISLQLKAESRVPWNPISYIDNRMYNGGESTSHHVIAQGSYAAMAVSMSTEAPSFINDTTNGSKTLGNEGATEAECSLFLFITYAVVMGSMCVFGLIGNTLSFMVLQWEKQNYVATFLLQVMAVVDNMFLCTTGYTLIYSATTVFLEETNQYLMPFNTVFIHPLVHISQLSTVWITVLIAFNRYIAICKPFQAPKLCTITRVRLQVFIMFVCIIVYNIPRFLEQQLVYKIDPVTNQTVPENEGTPLLRDKRYNIIYESLLYCLFVFLGPLVILIVLNTCLIRELMRARKRLLERQLPASMTGEDQENNLTLVMIVIILIFLVCQSPAFLNQLLYLNIGEDYYICGKAYFYYYHISNLMVTANSSLNFVVYCIFRKQFRQRLRAFCHRGQRQSLIMTDAYKCNGGTASIYSRNTNPVAL